jgi:hypothetical protein
MHGNANQKISLVRKRLENTLKRLSRDPKFESAETPSLNYVPKPQLVAVEELVGSKGSKSILGILSRIDEENLYLEDTSGYVKLDLSQAVSFFRGWFSE